MESKGQKKITQKQVHRYSGQTDGCHIWGMAGCGGKNVWKGKGSKKLQSRHGGVKYTV